jgi:hypothetical protein
MKTLVALLGAGTVLAACATEPYDYAYDDYGNPSYGYYGYEPGYYYGPSVEFGPAYYGRDYYGRDYRGHDYRGRQYYGRDYDRRRDDRAWHADTDGTRGSTSQFNPAPLQCCGPGSGPGGSVTQRDAERWGSGG